MIVGRELFDIKVSYRGRPVKVATVNSRMEEADPGTWGEPETLLYSCPVMATYAAETIEFTCPHWDVEVIKVV